jgi:hypothetical protein
VLATNLASDLWILIYSLHIAKRKRSILGIRSRQVVFIRNTVSLQTARDTGSYEHNKALCIPPSCLQMMATTGRRSAWNAVAVRVKVSISVKVSSPDALSPESTGFFSSNSPVLPSISAADSVLPWVLHVRRS